MKRCIAYRREGRSPNAWIRCSRRASKFSRFCRTHEDAVHGVVLGLLVNATDSERKNFAVQPAEAKAGDLPEKS